MFARNETANPAATGTTGNSFASFLLGLPDSASAAATPVQDANIRYQYYGFYFQDNWKVTPKLTLNLGLRYDVPVNWYAPTMGSVSLTAPNPAANNFPGAYVFAGQRSEPARCHALLAHGLLRCRTARRFCVCRSTRRPCCAAASASSTKPPAMADAAARWAPTDRSRRFPTA